MSHTVDTSRICFFAPNLEGGGAERIIAILASHFSNEDFKVDLLLTQVSGPYLDDLSPKVNVINLQCGRALTSLPKLIKYLKSQRPHILFTSHMHFSTVAIWAAKSARASTKVVIRQPTMLNLSYEKTSLSSHLKQKVFIASSYFADKIIVSSEAMLRDFKKVAKIPTNKLQIIHNPIPIQVIIESSKEPLEHSWFQPGEPPVIIAVGRLVAVKDFTTLIKAFSIVEKSLPSHLLILGEGPLRPELTNLINCLGLNNKVSMPGFVSNPYKYMKKSKVFVLSSLREGFPNSMVEAMACGIPIISTQGDGGAKEILENGKWGQLVPVGNENMMAEAILKAFEPSNDVNTLQRAKDFSIDIIIKKYRQSFDLE